MKKKRSFSNKIKKGMNAFFEEDKASKSVEDEVSLKTLLVIFVIGLVIILILYMFSNVSVKEQNTLSKQLETESHVEVNGSFIIDNFDYKNMTPFRFGPHSKDHFDLIYSNDSYESDKSLRIIIHPSDYKEDYAFITRINPLDILVYAYLNLYYKSTDAFDGALEISDGDDWYRHSFRIQKSSNWTLVTLSLTDFELLEFKSTVNGSLDMVIDYMFWWQRNQQSNSLEKQEILIDKIFLSNEIPSS